LRNAYERENMAEKKDALQTWKDRINAGIAFREKYGWEKKWDQWEKWLRSIFPAGVMPHNLIQAFYKAFVPKIYFRNPRIVVQPTRPDAYWQAMIVEKVMNQVIDEVGLKRQIKYNIGDAFWFTCGCLKVGFDSEFGFFPTEAQLESGEFGETWKGGMNLIEYHQDAKPGMPWALRVRPKNLVVPWGSENACTLPWIADKITRHIDDVKADPKYENKDNLQPNLKIDPRKAGISQEQLDEYVEMFEIRDLRTGKMMVISMDHDKFLLNQPDRLQVDGLPYSFLTFNEDLNQFWGIPDAQHLEAKQRELNEIDTQIMKHRRLAIIKFLYQTNYMSEDEIVKLTDENVGAGIKFTKGKVDEIFKELKIGIPPELIELKRMCREDMRELFGFSRVELGEFQGKTHVTKEEVQRVGRGSEIRLSERGDLVADLVKDVVHKFSAIIFGGLWKQARFVEIIGPDLMRYWIEFTAEELRGEYKFDIEPVEETPTTPEEREMQALRRLQVLAPFAMPQIDPNTGQVVAPPVIDNVELIRQYAYASGTNAERLLLRAPESMGLQQFQNQLPQMQQKLKGGIQGGSFG